MNAAPTVTPVVIERTSVVRAAAPKLWERVTSIEGIRYELAPVLSMTVPPGVDGTSLADADDLVGRPLGRSWVLLLRVLPVEYDAMTIAEMDPGRSFRERSSMLTLRRWEHERTLTPVDDRTCEVHDRLTLEPRPLLARVPGIERVLAAIVGRLFTHRHRRLVGYYAY